MLSAHPAPSPITCVFRAFFAHYGVDRQLCPAGKPPGVCVRPSPDVTCFAWRSRRSPVQALCAAALVPLRADVLLTSNSTGQRVLHFLLNPAPEHAHASAMGADPPIARGSALEQEVEPCSAEGVNKGGASGSKATEDSQGNGDVRSDLRSAVHGALDVGEVGFGAVDKQLDPLRRGGNPSIEVDITEGKRFGTVCGQAPDAVPQLRSARLSVSKATHKLEEVDITDRRQATASGVQAYGKGRAATWVGGAGLERF